MERGWCMLTSIMGMMPDDVVSQESGLDDDDAVQVGGFQSTAAETSRVA